VPFSNSVSAAQNVTILVYGGFTYRASCSVNTNDVVTVALFVLPPSGTYSWFSMINREFNDDNSTWTTAKGVFTAQSGTVAIEVEQVGSPSTLIRTFTSATLRGSAGSLARVEYMMTAHRSTDACEIEGSVIPLS
jgi:hypothetical protein